MITNWAERFERFVESKTRAAADADIPGLTTIDSNTDGQSLRAVGNEWTRLKFDGAFYETPASNVRQMEVSTVFVQSADGNTGTDRPIELGGGLTDKHLLYEGLSSVHADAILTGAKTIEGEQMVLGVWHPELVSLRAQLGLPRYPIQVVATRSGDLEIETALLYNVPELRVVILTGDHGAEALQPLVEDRRWITVISGGTEPHVEQGLEVLKTDFGVNRVSCIGGRTLATQLIDARVISDVYLTTSPKAGGEPGTPFYTGDTPPATRTIVRKHGRGAEQGVVFEHLVIV
jgi:riboflavin biosynthesis pyrimidine reductase